MRTKVMLLAAAVVSVVGIGVAARARVGSKIQFSQTHLYVELNDTAGDVGVQVFLDGEPWKQLKVFNPKERKILEILTNGSLKLQGLTELFFESSEPPLANLSLEEFKKRFPAGEYEFEGETLDGEEIEGIAVLTHAIPAAPVVLTPAKDSTQNVNNTVVSWLPVANPAGSQISTYQVIVTELLDVFPKRTFSVHVPANVTTMTIPAQFLHAGASYEFEVLAIETGGNQTITSSTFRT